MKRFLLMGVLIWPCLLSAESVDVPPIKLEIFYDFEVFRLLPRKWEFENLEDKLFRSNDGRTLYLGPSFDKNFFVVQPNHQVSLLKAPSIGKAYVNGLREFVLWYDSLADGIYSATNEVRHIPVPQRSRFGVSYDLEYSYLYTNRVTQVFQGLENVPLFKVDGYFGYKVVSGTSDLWVFGFSYLGTESSRKHQVRRFRKVHDTWLEMERIDLPEHYTLMDMDPFGWKALFLNDVEIAPQAFEYDFRKKEVLALGLIQQFAIYLHPDFKKPKETRLNPD